MSTPALVSELLQKRGLGRAIDVLVLRVLTPKGEGRSARAFLCRTRRGVFLVEEGGGEHAVEDLLEGAFTYVVGTVSDRLRVGARELEVPTGQGALALNLIGEGRLAGRRGRAAHLGESFAVEAQSRLERAFLLGWLGEDEPLLAFVHLEGSLPTGSSVLEGERAEPRLLLTPTRAAVAAIGKAGDVRLISVERPLEHQKGRLLVDGEALAVRRPSADAVSAVLRLLDRGPEDRMLELACENARARKRTPEHRAAAAHLLRLLVEAHDPLGTLSAFFLDDALGLQGLSSLALVDEALADLIATDAEARALTSWWERFGLDADAGLLLVDRARVLSGGARYVLPFHRFLVEKSHALAQNWLAAARMDFDLARHLLELEERDEAAQLLSGRLAKVPMVSLIDFGMKPDDETAAALAIRREGFELLADARRDTEGELEALIAWASVDPMSSTMLERLAVVGDVDTAAAAASALLVLAPGGLGDADPFEAHPPVHQLSRASLEHIEEEEGFARGAMARLQMLIAESSAPDNRALKAYCRPLSARESTAAVAALADAVTAFGVPGVEAFISDGEKSVGVSAYDGNPPFLLVGGKHLDPESEFFLGYRELRYAFGAEVAHLRFRHTRVTVDEVWAGAWDKGRAGLDLALTLLPAFKGARVIERVTKIVATAQKAAKRFDKPTRKAIKEEVIGARTDELIAAHQLMELTADRAGLVLAGDLRASLRAMLLSRPSYRAELPVAAHRGLALALAREDEDGLPFHPELAFRVEVLIGFFLGETYRTLRRALLEGEDAI